jgi:Reverse transcriptase (RNA-dependent DNA polymerase).
VLALVTINDHELSILFHVVPDILLKDPIVIGREILGDQFEMVLDKNHCTLSRLRNSSDPNFSIKKGETKLNRPIYGEKERNSQTSHTLGSTNVLKTNVPMSFYSGGQEKYFETLGTSDIVKTETVSNCLNYGSTKSNSLTPYLPKQGCKHYVACCKTNDTVSQGSYEGTIDTWELETISQLLSIQEPSFDLGHDPNILDYEVGISTHENLYDSIVTELTSDNRYSLLTILQQFEPFLINGIPQNRVKTGELIISLKDPSKIVNRRPYKLGPAQQDAVREIVDELLEAKIIRPSRSPFASPVLLVPKKTGGYRMCVDYRALNENTIPQRYPLPLIQDQIARLRGAKFFTSLDMASGFHQIPVHPESIEKTAFITFHGVWEYLAMPYGLRNAPSVFQRAVMEALGKLAHDYVVVFMDDILIISENVDQALERLNIVLKILTEAGFTLNLAKCSFVVKRVTYLGYEVENGEISPNTKKVEALTKLPPPTTVHAVQQFLGLASYFRKFIQNFSRLAAPLFKLVSGPRKKNSKQITWLPEHEVIRQKIISILTSDPVLKIFDPRYPIELHTDASSSGYAGILMNIVDKIPRVVSYFSKRTTPEESRYHSYELETLAVVKSIQHFIYYLQGYPFKVVTDCESFKATQNKKELIPRVQRWWTFLQGFEFTIEYRKGSKMSHVDFLSRNPLQTEDSSYQESPIVGTDVPDRSSQTKKVEKLPSRPHGKKGKKLRENYSDSKVKHM